MTTSLSKPLAYRDDSELNSRFHTPANDHKRRSSFEWISNDNIADLE